MRTASSPDPSPRESLRALMIFFIAIVCGVLIFMMIAIYMSQANGPLELSWLEYREAISWILAIICLSSYLVARQQLKKGVEAAKKPVNPLSDKLKKYRVALIRYLAICEMPALACIIFFMLTGYFAFLVFAAVMLGCMLSAAPVRRRVVAALELDGEEQKELD